MPKLVNLTPHSITLYGEQNGIVAVLPPSGTVARLAVTREKRPHIYTEVRLGDIDAQAGAEDDTPIGVNIPVSRPTLGEVTGLPTEIRWATSFMDADGVHVDTVTVAAPDWETALEKSRPANMPDVELMHGPDPATVYIVSALVAETVRRPDVMSPGELVRDAAGVIVGAKGLCTYV